jgi:hypothetical protein
MRVRKWQAPCSWELGTRSHFLTTLPLQPRAKHWRFPFVQCFTSEDHKASYHVLHIIHQWGWPWPNHKHHPWPLALLLVYSVLRSTYSLLKVCMIYFFPVFTVCLSQWEKQFFMYFVHRQDCQMSRTEPYTWLALSKYLFNKWVKTPSTTNV